MQSHDIWIPITKILCASKLKKNKDIEMKKKEVQKSSMKQNKQKKTEEKIKKRIYFRYKMV